MGLTPIVCIAQDYIQGKTVDDLRLRQAILELSDNKTEHLPGYLPLVPGMPVLLTENVASELGLSNGTRGIFRQLVYDESSEDVRYQDKNFPPNTKFITQPKYALVEFPGCKLVDKLAELQSKIVPIAISEQKFLFDAKELLPENVAKTAKINKKTTKFSIKRWKRDIEGRRDEARNYLISGENTLEVRDDETQIEVVATEIPTSPIKTRATRVPPVTTTNAILFPTKQDIIRQFTLSTQQKYAFMIITSHLDGENHAYTGI
ncbi:unnamed protein product [Rotaria sordida]|uniref:Uncharacterized protein n=1 Tax=Rotaria sordida TaxID=392033 RepID=A0A814RGI9_9BILA|nr:unnamed protein product [Rotaria sordida]